MVENYYTILGLDKNKSTQYTDAEIKKAYRKMAMKYHPDRNQGNVEAENKFKDIQKAYDVLSDKEKRHNYDTYGSEDGAQYAGSANTYGNYDFGGFDFEDLFKKYNLINEILVKAYHKGAFSLKIRMACLEDHKNIIKSIEENNISKTLDSVKKHYLRADKIFKKSIKIN